MLMIESIVLILVIKIVFVASKPSTITDHMESEVFLYCHCNGLEVDI
jgi:hypothetical protein